MYGLFGEGNNRTFGLEVSEDAEKRVQSYSRIIGNWNECNFCFSDIILNRHVCVCVFFFHLNSPTIHFNSPTFYLNSPTIHLNSPTIHLNSYTIWFLQGLILTWYWFHGFVLFLNSGLFGHLNNPIRINSLIRLIFGLSLIFVSYWRYNFDQLRNVNLEDFFKVNFY